MFARCFLERVRAGLLVRGCVPRLRGFESPR
jgi:hypothetical protein